MWQTDESKTGIAVWNDQHGCWSLDARGGKADIRLLPGDLLTDPQSGGAAEWLRLAPVDQPVLPDLEEQFVRGKELHLYYPQGESDFGLRLALEPIRSTPENLVLQVTVDVQTSLLDSHPKLDIVASGGEVRSLAVDDLAGHGGSPPITVCDAAATVAVLLGPHDAPFTTNQSLAQEIRLRLFGDFLEKGVIRKARPWVIIDRGREIGDPQLRRIWRELSQSPLPLTP